MSCPHGVWHEEDCEMCVKDARIAELESLLAARDRMLLVRFEDARYDGYEGSESDWLADLKARAEEGSKP